jgi:hypothetical protein
MSKMIVNIAVFGAFVVMVLFLGFFLWQTLFASEETSQTESQSKIAYSQKQSRNENSSGGRAPPSIANPSDKAIARYTKWLAIFTLFLVLATIGLFVSGERAVRVGNRSADAAHQSARIAEDSLIKLQRAFVGLQQIRYLSHIGPDDKIWWSIHVVWENFGASRAKNVKVYVAKYYEDKDMDDNFPFTVPEQKKGTFIGPKAVIGSGELRITGDELVEVRDGKKFLYFWGRIDYRDIFENTPDHVTKFLTRVVDIRGDPTKFWDDKTNIVELTFVGDNRHTCADEECGPN